MKTLKLAIMVFLLTGVAAAQTSSGQTDAPGVLVLKKSVHKQMYSGQFSQAEDTLWRTLDAPATTQRVVTATLYGNTASARANQQQAPIPIIAGVPTSPRGSSGKPLVMYIYDVKINNTSSKTIRKLVWEYVVVDEDTQREVGNHRFTSMVRLHPGKSAQLVGHSYFPPSSIVDAKKADNVSPGKYSERVVIHLITYNDKSVWKRNSK
jgi:hypothetical protein